MIRIRQIKIDVLNNQDEFIRKNIYKKLLLDIKTKIDYKINKRSIDARNKNQIFYIYEIDVTLNDIDEERLISKLNNKDIFIKPDEEYKFPIKIESNIKPIIVGCGPAGLFCAYLLAENGIKPIIIERGERIEDRIKSVENFWQTNILNKNSNIQFGEGGAGTFSDGKLNTSVKDKFNRQRKVLEIFVENGAPKEILYDSNPHIGTDILRNVIVNMRNKIINMGGEIYYNCKFTNIRLNENVLDGIEVNNNKYIKCNKLILAIGHSARDTFEMLSNNGLEIISKPFAVGIRIEHPQDMINISQYGEKYADKLPPANYKLTYQTKTGRGVYTFCMCPGGYVVNASSEDKKLVVNGMSNYKRDSKMANSAVITTITSKDYGPNPLDGIKFQRELEENAYKVGQGFIPVEYYADYKSGIISQNNIEKIMVKGKTCYANLNEIFPEYINASLKEGIENFGKKIKNYNMDNAIVLGVESRTSSPIRMIRNEFFESNIKGIFPCGEGAGYAGGITTSAIDGIKVAENIFRV